jgi:hypothetical protein
MGASMFLTTKRQGDRFAPGRDALRHVATAETSEASNADRAPVRRASPPLIRGG